MLNLAGPLSVAELSLYLIATFPILYVLIRRKNCSTLGCGYLFVFATLRVTGAVLQIKQHRRNAINWVALILISIGLSPLLWTTVGSPDVAYDSTDNVFELR